MFAGPGRLDGRIQGQQIGLIRNANHRTDDFTNLLRIFFQLLDQFGGFQICIGAGLHPFDQAFDIRGGALDQRLQELTFLQREFSQLIGFFSGLGDLVDCRTGLFRTGRRLFGGCRDLLHITAQLFGGAGRLG